MRPVEVAVVVVLVLLHLILHVGLGIGSGAPDLFTLALLILARESHMAVAALVGLGLGLLEDAQGLMGFGANALALATVGAAGSRTREFFLGDSWFFLASYLFLGKWARDAIHWLTVGRDNREGFLQALVVESGSASLYVMAVGMALALLTGVLRDRGGVR